MTELPSWVWLQLIALAAGFLRGLSGFGAALVLAPATALVIGPQNAVGLTVILNVLTSFQLFVPAARVANWKLVTLMSVAATFAFPLGMLVLLAVDAHFLKRAIGITTIAAALLICFRIRFAGGYTRSRTLAVGALSGFLTGVSGIGGPPAVLYILSGGESAAVMRANFIAYLSISQVVAVPPLVLAHIITRETALSSFALIPAFLLATWAGARVFHRVNDALFLRIATATVIALGLVAIVF